MTDNLVRPLFALCALAACATPVMAQRWQMQYLYDESKSALLISDIQCPSATRCVAVGSITRSGGVKPVALVTSDGGAHWATVPLKEQPFSLFFLNENLGWMVTEKGLWRTTEAGKNWTKLPDPRVPGQRGERPFAQRVLFTDENHGWAACSQKTVLETRDGGQHWSQVAAASEPPCDPRTCGYRWISFATPEAGIVIGSSSPPDSSEPSWLEPDQALRRRESPHLSITVETFDGGKTWRSSTGSLFGQITVARFGKSGTGIGLIEHAPSFQYPSEVVRLTWPSGKNDVAYRDKNFFVSDVWVTPGGEYYAAGVLAISRLPSIVPQKVRVLKSRDFKEWTPIATDYRAVANRAMLAGSGEDLWLATNNGMILKLMR